MAGKDHSFEIREQWFDINDLSLPGKVNSGEVMSIVSARPVRVNLTVIVPAEFIDGKPPKFDIDSCVPVRRVLDAISKNLVDTLVAVAEARRADSAGDADAYATADKLLTTLNDFMKKSFKQLRPLIRDAVAKTIGGSVKAEDLQTVGSLDFKEYELKPGAFANEVDVEPAMLDLTKAFKNRRWQECGLAWKGKDGVISVKRRKEFKASELKELREYLPKNKSVGASILGCRFMAESGSTIVLEVREKDTPPGERVIVRAIKKQSQHVVKVRLAIRQDELEEEEEEEEEEETPSEKGKAKGKTKGKTKGTAKKGTKKSK